MNPNLGLIYGSILANSLIIETSLEFITNSKYYLDDNFDAYNLI